MKPIIFIITLMLTCVISGENKFPITEKEWLREAVRKDGANQYNKDRKVALLIKTIHMRLDAMVRKRQIDETAIEDISKLKNKLHTREWSNKSESEESDDIFKMLNILYLRLIIIDNSQSEIYEEYNDSDKKVITKVLYKRDCPELGKWKSKWNGKF